LGGTGPVPRTLGAWVGARRYGQARSELLEAALADFHDRGLRSPQRRDVHLHHHGEPSQPLDDQAIKPAL